VAWLVRAQRKKLFHAKDAKNAKIAKKKKEPAKPKVRDGSIAGQPDQAARRACLT
jgi:hypothetical protein